MPTILLPRNLKEIKNELSKDDRVVITTCTNCPEKCGIKVFETAKQLAREVKVVGILKYPTGCNASFVEEYKERLLRMNPTALVVMDCNAAALSHKFLYPQLKIFKGCISVGFGVADPKAGYIECLWPFPGYEKHQGLRIKLYDGTIIKEGGKE